MRPIKFRGKAKDDNKWVFGYYYPKQLISTDERYVITIHCIKDEKFGFEKPISIQTLGQFTGLLDKNGKEIYEGDIVKDNFGRIMQIGFWKYKMCFLAISKTNFHHSDFSDWIVEDTNVLECEIIGNIHEHKHLLE